MSAFHGSIAGMTDDVLIAQLSLLVSLVTAVASGYLAYKALVFTAKPRLAVQAYPKDDWHVSSTVSLVLRLRNKGHWYARPAATGLRATVNLDEPCEPLLLRFGSDLEQQERKVLRGKGSGGRRSKYLEATGIWLTASEDPEDLEVTFRTPDIPGKYNGWVILYAREGDCGSHSFSFVVH